MQHLPRSLRFPPAWSVILITIVVIVWDPVVSAIESTTLTIFDVVRYRIIRGGYNVVMYRWRWRIVEKVRLMWRQR
jgi:hypothetical protein